MEKLNFSSLQKEEIIKIIKSKNNKNSECLCDSPKLKVLDGHYYLPLLSAKYGSETITLINILCENCGRLELYSRDFFLVNK